MERRIGKLTGHYIVCGYGRVGEQVVRDLEQQGQAVVVIETGEGVTLQNQQNSSPIYHSHTFGLLTFKTTGRHTIAVSLVDGPADKASLQAIRLSPVE